MPGILQWLEKGKKGCPTEKGESFVNDLNNFMLDLINLPVLMVEVTLTFY